MFGYLSLNSSLLASNYCLVSYDSIQFANTSTRAAMSSIFVLVCLVTVCINSLVIYCIYRTNQWGNQSTFLVLVAAMCSVLCSLTSDIWSAIYILMAEEISCKMKTLIFSISITWLYAAVYSFCLISIDRFFKVKFLQSYPDVMTPLRFRLMLLIHSCVTVLQGFLLWIGPKFRGDGGGAMLTLPINFIVVPATLVFYLVSVKILRNLKKRQRLISEETRKLTNMAAIYIVLYIVFYLPLLLYQIMLDFISSYLSKTQIAVLSFMVLYLPSFHGNCNGIVFLVKNRSSRRFIFEKLRKLRTSFPSFKPNQVAPVLSGTIQS